MFLVQQCLKCNTEFFAHSKSTAITICDKCHKKYSNNTSITQNLTKNKSTSTWNSEPENFSHLTDKMLKSIKRDTTLADIASEMELLS